MRRLHSPASPAGRVYALLDPGDSAATMQTYAYSTPSGNRTGTGC